jgi:hypothetical protein
MPCVCWRLSSLGCHQDRVVFRAPDLDLALTAQIIVTWAGEGGEEPWLGWWPTDLVSEYGSNDFGQPTG